MSKVMSSRGSVVDFELMKVMNQINSPKNGNKQPVKKKYEEVEIPYIESFSTEELLKKHLENIPKVETVQTITPIVSTVEKVVPRVETVEPIKTVEEPVPLIIAQPTVNDNIETIVDNTVDNGDNKASNNFDKRRR